MSEPTFEQRLGEAVLPDWAEGPAGELLGRSPLGFLAMSDADGPYCLPVSFAWDGEHLVFHTGPGKKSDALAADDRVCLAVVENEGLQPGDDPCGDNFVYRSALVYGSARLLLEDGDRERALRAVVAKYHPAGAGQPFRPASFARTLVYSISVRAVTYKQRPRT